jgi:hypothetical protein
MEELTKFHNALHAVDNESDHKIVIDLITTLGEDFKHVKVNPSIVDTLKDWPKSPVSNPPNWTPPPVMPTYPWSPFAPKPNPFNPLNPWDITAAVLNENTESVTNRMPEVLVTPYSEQNESEQMCHKLNISVTDSNSFYDKDYIDKLFHR